MGADIGLASNIARPVTAMYPLVPGRYDKGSFRITICPKLERGPLLHRSSEVGRVPVD